MEERRERNRRGLGEQEGKEKQEEKREKKEEKELIDAKKRGAGERDLTLTKCKIFTV